MQLLFLERLRHFDVILFIEGLALAFMSINKYLHTINLYNFYSLGILYEERKGVLTTIHLKLNSSFHET